MNLSLHTSLPVAHNYNTNSFYISADHKGSPESTPEAPNISTFIAQNRETPCQVTDQFSK